MVNSRTKNKVGYNLQSKSQSRIKSGQIRACGWEIWWLRGLQLGQEGLILVLTRVGEVGSGYKWLGVEGRDRRKVGGLFGRAE